MTYTNVFGGNDINPAYLSYKLYELTVDVRLVWPFEALDGANVAADKIDTDASTTGFSIFLPDASLVSVGEDILFNNIGAAVVSVRDFDGVIIAVMPANTAWYVYLTDNADPAGLWHITQFGATVGTAQASVLAGAGLRASNTNKIDQDLVTSGLVGSQTLTDQNRAQVLRNTGGGALHIFAAATTLGPLPSSSNGWFVIEINNGTGNLILQPQVGEFIDGLAEKILAPGESCVVYCFGTGFATMGYGRVASTSISGISIDCSGGPATPTNIVLNTTQIVAQVQDFVGTLNGNRTIVYGEVTGYWFVYNNTTNSGANTFNISFKGGAGDVTPVTIPQGNFAVLRSQAGSLDLAFTASAASVSLVQAIAGQLVTSPPAGINTTGTVGLATVPSITVGTYGNASNVAQVTFDQFGRATAGANVPIAIPSSAITDLATAFEYLVPPATMVPFAGQTLPPIIPPGPTFRAWLLCDGAAVSRTVYSRLYAALGGATSPWGQGDSSTTFNVPDTRGSVLAGADPTGLRLTAPWFPSAGVVSTRGGVQSHTHTVAVGSVSGSITGTTSGALSVTVSGVANRPSDNNTNATGGGSTVASDNHGHTVDATGSATGSLSVSGTFSGFGTGDATASTTIQPTLIIRHIIKT